MDESRDFIGQKRLHDEVTANSHIVPMKKQKPNSQGDEGLNCQLCSKSFTTRSNLKRHKKSVHKINDD
jgi:hypothetical protein